ncbi:hypothetical protein IJG04_01810 [Candidatus Saccharibacteria bacterium]|nr:hypothetical protein [Candidatus Saccharibacteria bacterium]
MYHKIRITVVSLVVVVTCMLSSVATLSYFTDSDIKTNSFTIGNVSTTLAIYDDVTGEVKHVFDADSHGPLESNVENIPFYLQAENTGNIPVYQRFRVVIPITLAGVVTLNLPTMNEDCVIDTTAEAGSTCSNDDYTVTYKPSVNVGDVPTYAEYYIISNSVIDANGLTSEWPTEGIRTGEIPTDIAESLPTCDANNSNNCVLGIKVYSDAIQTTGFENAITAFASVGETY